MVRLRDSASTVGAIELTVAVVDRVAWFKSALEGSTGPLTDDELQLLTQRYVGELLHQTKILQIPQFH